MCMHPCDRRTPAIAAPCAAAVDLLLTSALFEPPHATSNFIIAALNLAVLPPLSAGVLYYLGGDWTLVFIAFLISTIPQYLMVRALEGPQRVPPQL